MEEDFYDLLSVCEKDVVLKQRQTSAIRES
jgi:hypothetical protein